MKCDMIYVFCILLVTFVFTLPFTRSSREISLDTLKKLFAPYMVDMEKRDAAWVRKQYHLDSAAYEQALVYGAASAMEVDEIAAFRQADKTKRGVLQKLCQERTDRQLKSFQGYAPR